MSAIGCVFDRASASISALLMVLRSRYGRGQSWCCRRTIVKKYYAVLWLFSTCGGMRAGVLTLGTFANDQVPKECVKLLVAFLAFKDIHQRVGHVCEGLAVCG